MDDEALEQRFRAMQALYTAARADLAALQAFHDALPAMQARFQQLQDFYTKDWLEQSEAIAQRPELEKRLFRDVAPGDYSILGQDTIWDVLQDTHETTRAILKRLVMAL